jgi:hypothetical protein
MLLVRRFSSSLYICRKLQICHCICIRVQYFRNLSSSIVLQNLYSRPHVYSNKKYDMLFIYVPVAYSNMSIWYNNFIFAFEI